MLLRRVAETYKTLTTFRFSVHQTDETKGEDVYRRSDLRLVLIGEGRDRLRVERQVAGVARLAILNGPTVLFYAPGEKRYEVRPSTAHGLGESSLFRRYEQIGGEAGAATMGPDETLSLGDATLTCRLVKTTRAQPNQPAVRVQYWIETARPLVRKQVTERDVGRGTTAVETVTFEAAEIGIALPEGTFNFTPPPGVSDAGQSPPAAPPEEKSWNGVIPPDFALKDISGRLHRLSDWTGKVVVLNFWATWCVPCVEEMALFELADRQFRDKGLIVAGITEESAQTASAFFAKNRYTYTSLVDEGGETIDAYQVHGWPSTVVIDRRGKVAFRKDGVLQPADLGGVLRDQGIW